MIQGVRFQPCSRTSFFALVLFLFSRAAPGIDINSLPQPSGYVNDFAHVLNSGEQARLTVFCASVERQLGVQFALVTVDTVGDTPISDFAVQLARKWGVGDKKTNQGVLLLLAIRDRKSDIETGRGIEPYINDGFAGGTLRSMRPALRSGDYGTALMMGARAMAQQIAEGKGIPFSADSAPMADRVHTDRQTIPFPLIILGIFVLLMLFGGRRGGGGGFLWGMLLGSLLGGGRDRRDGGWGNGGGFGGNSGGGGGFGGFGGGDFGGGGANSDW